MAGYIHVYTVYTVASPLANQVKFIIIIIIIIITIIIIILFKSGNKVHKHKQETYRQTDRQYVPLYLYVC